MFLKHDRTNQKHAKKQDRDAVIAAVEDARVAQEEEATRLRDQLTALHRTSPRDGSANNNDDEAEGSLHPQEGGRCSTGTLGRGSRDEMVEGEEVREWEGKGVRCVLLFSWLLLTAVTTTVQYTPMRVLVVLKSR